MMRNPLFVLSLCGLLLPGLASAEAPVVLSAQDAGLSELVTGLVRANLPDAFEKRKNWGHTIDVWDGVHLSLDGARLKTKRKSRTVNHGTWSMYRAELSRPGEFAVQVGNIRRLDDGRAAFDAGFSAPLSLFARLSEWQRGLQLFSFSADADALVRLQITCAVRTRLQSGSGYLPDVVLEPEVTSARIVLESFRLHRVSQLHGPLIKELGEEAHGLLQKEINDRNTEIVTRINQQIAKKQDKLRISLADLASTRFGDLREWLSRE